MKFYIFIDKAGEWRWNAQVNGKIIFSSGEGFKRPQGFLNSVRKNIIREDEKLELSLVKALNEAGLNEKGNKLKAVKD